jgi:DNA-binding CsgD family transcriptional regulator
MWHAEQAAAAATRAGDFFDLQSALLAMLSLETRRGNADRAVRVEKQLLELRANEAQRASFIISSQAHRHAWAGRFAEAHRMFGSVLDRQSHAPDRALVYSMHALCLAMDGQGRNSFASAEKAVAIVESERNRDRTSGAIQCEAAVLFVVVAEVIAGRMTSAQRIFRREERGEDPLGRAMHAIVERIVRAGRSPSYSIAGVEADLEVIRGLGFGGYAEHLQHAVHQLESSHHPETGVVLTPSELRIIRSLASGLTPKDIAAEMGRSVYTVQTHIANVIEKLGCHGRAEAVAAARQLGLLTSHL